MAQRCSHGKHLFEAQCRCRMISRSKVWRPKHDQAILSHDEYVIVYLFDGSSINFDLSAIRLQFFGPE